MISQLRDRIYQSLCQIELIDPHTHINAHDPASHTLVDILGYHYYAELAHSAGLGREQIEDESLSAKEKVGRLIEAIGAIDNTIQYSWLIDICQRFFDFEGDRIDATNWEALYDASESKMDNAQWADEVLRISNVKSVF